MRPASSVLEPLRDGPASSTTLVKALSVPQPAVSRALTALQREGRVLKMGATRGTRYGLMRTVPGAGSSWPVYQVDSAGRIHELGRLNALMPQHFYFETDRAALRGMSEGLPWFLADQRQAGFLAGGLAAAHADLALPGPAREWTEDQHLAWCTRRGWDLPGDLIVGAEAFEGLLRAQRERKAVRAAERATAYPRLAKEVLARVGSFPMLGGEQPKFTVLADHDGHPAHALVKFSPPIDAPEGRRWADLLMAEHMAHAHLNARGAGAAHSRVYRYSNRIFLEIDRFDRVGLEGRRGVVTLRAALQARGAKADSWARAALLLAEAGVLPKNDADQIRLVEAFARLIGNTDLDFANLLLFDRHDGRFALAPVLDVLPMLFAPQGGQLPDKPYVPPEPTPATYDLWAQARKLAEGYWESLANEPLISAEFRKLCSEALAGLRAA